MTTFFRYSASDVHAIPLRPALSSLANTSHHMYLSYCTRYWCGRYGGVMPEYMHVFSRMGGWVGPLVAGVGIIVLLFGAHSIKKGNLLLANEVTATATITNKYKTTGRNTTNYHIELSYDTPMGTRNEKASVERSYYNAHMRSEQVPVYYLPDDPGRFELASGFTLETGQIEWFYGSLIIIAGLIIGGYFIYQARRAFGLLKSGSQIEATIYEIKESKKNSSLRFGFSCAGDAIEKKSFIRSNTVFAGLEPNQSIPVVYDPRNPRFAFWVNDLL